MKKIGFLLFLLALIVGVVFANVFSFGRVDAADWIKFSFKSGVRGSGNVVTEDRGLSGFNSVKVGGAFSVEIVSQREFAVSVEADDNLLPMVRTEVEDGVLKIWSEGSIRSSGRMLVRVSAPDIERVVSSGATKVTIEAINNSAFEIDTSGASKVTMSGVTGELKIGVSGAAKIDAESLSAKQAVVGVSGAGKIVVNVSESLEAKVSGAGSIRYAGSPKKVVEKKSGAGKIRPV